MTQLQANAGLDLPWRKGACDTLTRKRLGHMEDPNPLPLDTIWSPSFFGLDQVTAYVDAHPEHQSTILAECARATLEEAYFIEKAGVSFAAKMTLLAKTADERSLYALFAAEEAAHLAAIQGILGVVDEAKWRSNPFLGVLNDLIEQCDRRTGQLVIQVVLEGWSLTHYSALRKACQAPELQAILNRIVADEAGHHNSGIALLETTTFDANATQRAVDPLAHMLSMVQIGPAFVVSALEKTLGGFTQQQRHQAYAQLDATNHARERLTRLRSLMEKAPTARPVVDALAKRALFSPLPLEALV